MKKMLFLVLAVVMVLTMAFVGCSKKTNCAVCGEKTKCTEIEYLGEDVWVCEDCESGLNTIQDAANAVQDQVNDLNNLIG